MFRFYLNTFLIVVDACEGVNHKWEVCSSKNNTQAPVHPHINLSKYQTQIKPTWWKWLDEIPMYPQEHFGYYKRLFWPVLCHKRIGLPCCTLFTVTVTCSLPIILLSNYLLPTVLEEITLLKPLVISLCSSLGSTLLLIKRTMIDPLYLWFMKTLFWRRFWGVKHSW